MRPIPQLTSFSGRGFSRLGPALALTLAGSSLVAATIVKTDNNADLNQPASWSGNLVPGAADTALWNSTVATAANCSGALGGDLLWSGLTISNPAALVQISGPGTLTLTNLSLANATVDLTLNCGLAVYGSPTWGIASGRTLTIGSAMGGSGNIQQQGGKILLAPGLGALPSTMTYSVTNNSTLDLGGNSQTLANLVTPWGATNFITNGSLTLSLSGGDFNPLPGANNSLQDLSGVSNFTVTNTARNFSYNPGAGSIGVALYLAKTNYLAVNQFNIGNNAPATGGASYLYLGQSNVINAGQLQVGGYRPSGSMLFKSGLINPSVKIRGTDGVSRLPNWWIGYYNAGSGNGLSTNDFTGGTIDCQASTLVVGEHAANGGNAATGVLVVDGAASSVDVLNATVAYKNATTGAATASGTLNQLNGTVKLRTLTMGNNQSTNTGITIKASYLLNGGTLRGQTVQSGSVGTSENSASFRTFFWTNGVLQNYDSTTPLTIPSSSPVTLVAGGSGSKYLRADAGLTNTLQTVKSTAAFTVVKDGAGYLDLQGGSDNAYLALNVSNGVVLLDKASASGVHAVGSGLTLNGGSAVLAGSGGDQIYNGNLVTINNGTLDLNGQTETIGGLAGIGGVLTDNSGSTGALTVKLGSGTNAFGGSLSGNLNLTKDGAGRLTLSGADGRLSGVNSVVAGTLEIGNGITGSTVLVGDTTVGAGSVLAFNCPGTITPTGSLSGAGDVQQNGTGTVQLGWDTHTGLTSVNAGTLKIQAGATSVAGSVITVASGATLDLTGGAGSLVLSGGQVITGAGTVSGGYWVGSACTNAGSLTINGNLTLLDGSVLAPGTAFAPGTTTVNGSVSNVGNNQWLFNLSADPTPGNGINSLLVVNGNLDLGNPMNGNTPALVLRGTPVSGTYTLATFQTFSGDASALGRNLVGGGSRYTYATRISGNSLVLDVTGNPVNLVWRGDGLYNYWDSSNPSNPDWWNQGTSALDVFNPGDNVVFNDSSANFGVNLLTSVTPLSLTVNAANNYTFLNAGGSIDGPTALTKTNSGILTIQNNNSFSGLVNLNGGTVSVGAVALNGLPSPLGSGSTLAFNGGTLQYTGPAVGVGGFNRQLLLGPSGGTIDQESSSGVYFFITNQISGPGSLTKIGNQQLILGDVTGGTGSNSYAGGTYINAGSIQIRNAAALGSGNVYVNANGLLNGDNNFTGTISNNIFLQGGTLGGASSGNYNYVFGGVITLVTNSTISSDRSFTIAGDITGPGDVQKTGTNTLTLLGANTFGGATVLNSGTLQLGNGMVNATLPGAISNYATLTAVVSSNAVVELPGPIHGTGTLTENGLAGNLWLTGSNDWTGTVNVNAGALWINNSAALGVGPKAVKLNNGTAGHIALHLCGTNGSIVLATNLSLSTSWDGGVLFNEAGSNAVLGSITMTTGGGGSYFVVNAGILNLGGTIGASATSRNLTLGGPADGVISGTVVDSFGAVPSQLKKQDAGTWRLTGTNTTVAPANVSGGTLLVQGQWAGPANVLSGGTLGGAGTIQGAVTVAAGGTLSPGAGLGSLTCNSNLTLAGNLFVEVNNSLTPSSDFVQVGGALTNSGIGTLVVTNLGPALSVGDKFVLFNQPLAGGERLVVANADPASNVVWSNSLAVDGSIQVLAIGSPVPAAPAALTATGTNAAVLLSWTASAGASSYNLKRATTSGGYSTSYLATGVTDTNYLDTTAMNGTSYYYVVTAVNVAGESAPSPEASALPLSTVPARLSSSLSAGALSLSWPTDHLGWRLLVQTNRLNVGVSTNWSIWPNSTNITSVVIPVVSTNPTVFFRLAYPNP